MKTLKKLRFGALFTIGPKSITHRSKIYTSYPKIPQSLIDDLYQSRHQFANDLVKIADLGTVQSLMGHTSPSTTIGYVQAIFDDMRKALKRRTERKSY